MTTEKHSILGEKVHVYRRENSRFWQTATFLNGRNHRVSTKEESLKLAKEFAEDWYLTLRGKHSRGELISEKTFTKAGEQFLREFEADTAGERKATSAPCIHCGTVISRFACWRGQIFIRSPRTVGQALR